MRPNQFERAANAVATTESHGALELLGAGFRVEFGANLRCAFLIHAIDGQHRLLARCDALLDEIALCDDGEETTW